MAQTLYLLVRDKENRNAPSVKELIYTKTLKLSRRGLSKNTFTFNTEDMVTASPPYFIR